MFIKNTIKRILNSRLFKLIGVSLINYDLLKYLKHYPWVFSFTKVPTLKIIYSRSRKVNDEDIELCRRVISAYHKATSDKLVVERTTGKLWSESLKKYCGKLLTIMDSGNAKELAGALSMMFMQDFVYGLASGSLVDNARSSLGAKIWSMKYQDNLISLAEYLGVVRAESTQQGLVTHSLRESLDSIVAKIEAKIGISIGFPDIGSPYGIKANYSLITMEHPEHLYVALRVNQAVRDHSEGSRPLSLVEIGAGFGGLAYWIMKLRKITLNSYTIIDLPLINALQGYFLAQAFGASAVKLYGEAPDNTAMISILPNFAVESEAVGKIDLLINENSMPEMPEEIVKKYIMFAKKHFTGLFFSYNHEAYSVVFGKPQVSVPEVVENVGGFIRVSRNASWLRSGYVEEVYRSQGG